MKGIVFTEFLEMVEEKFSLDLLDRIINEAELPNGGAYTAVGTYDHRELVTLVTRLSTATQIAVPTLLRGFGEHLFGRFAHGYPQFFRAATDAFQFLVAVEDRIHTEVRKLYPEAELPRFRCQEPRPGQLIVEYESVRAFADLAEGLMLGCIAHFKHPIALSREDLPGEPGTQACFTLVRQ